MAEVTVLYDRQCAVCRLLASLLSSEAPAHWIVLAWQDFPEPQRGPPSMLAGSQNPSELALRMAGVWYEGEGAWQVLVESLPRLQRYQHLAARIGISAPISARWLRRLGHGLRRLCPRCPRSAAGSSLRPWRHPS